MRRRSGIREQYLDPVEAERDGTIRASDLISPLLRRWRKALGDNKIDVSGRWRMVVDESVFESTQAISWRGGLLTVGVRSPAHLQEYTIRHRTGWIDRWLKLHPDLPVDRIKLVVLSGQDDHGNP